MMLFKNKSKQEIRRSGLFISFIVVFVIPTLLSITYYSFIASERYATTIGFSIRGIKTSMGLDGLGAITGLASSGSTRSDSYIVLEYLKSRELVEKLDQQLDLRSAYSQQDIDSLSRMDPDATIEEFADYWQSRIDINYDPTSGIIDITVQAFSAPMAKKIAEGIVVASQNLINDLSASAREDSLKFALKEVTLQEQRLKKIHETIRRFREKMQTVDLSATAALDMELIAKLEAKMIGLNTKISLQEKALDKNAPSLVALKREANALANEIEVRKSDISGKRHTAQANGSLTSNLVQFENYEVEKKLVQRAYASALNSLEQARRDADREQRYLAVHLSPREPELAEYPKRFRNSLIAAFIFFSVWGIGSLLVYSVRDHLT
ncbi:hypothetical protein [Polycladidibacter stylochi]|uniref:hypothetical protein n=1 Tax=Polycladidibacter stylochi TaxID=1807766 RepID=UPI000829ABED|nr:hypothetical protein [Pseudovibrio stylochi]